jgi:hypothetical protein
VGDNHGTVQSGVGVEPADGANQIKPETSAPGCRESVQVIEKSEQKISINFEFTPEQQVVISKALEKWRQENPEQWKREEMLLSFCKEYLVNNLVENNHGDMVVVDSPYQVVINKCEECSKNTITTDKGVMEVNNAVVEKAMEDGKILKIEKNGKIGRNGHTISPALRKKVINRDHCRCSVPGCGRTHYLEVHHIVPVQAGGEDREDNMLTLCSTCHDLVHKYRSLIITGKAPMASFLHKGRNGIKIPFGGE